VKAREKPRPRPTHQNSATAAPAGSPPTASPAFLLATFALLAAAVLAIWAGSSAVGDLYMSLSGGRDVALGHLGRPDDWSFTTGGRVWVNQNWLSHVLIYLFWLDRKSVV
jgi:hypothetical protein